MTIPLIYQIRPDDIVETFSVKRTERMWTPSNKTISYNSHLSKNLWNQAQYIVDGEYRKSGEIPTYRYIDAILSDINRYKDNPDFDNYHKLPPATSQQILKVHNRSWISFKEGEKGYFDPGNPKRDNYTGKPKKPKYKEKDGEFILIFTNQQCKIRNGYLIFPKILNGFKVKVRFDDSYTQDGFDLYGDGDYGLYDKNGNLKKNIKLKEVRIIPQGVGYIVEIVYEKEIIKNNIKYDLDPKRIMGIDLGVENLIALVDNIGNRPIIVKGDILKSVNQWYNKREAELQAIYDRVLIGCSLKRDKKGNIKYIVNKTGRKMETLTDNRKWAIMDILHKLSRYIVNLALELKVKTIAIGKNPGWKQKIKIGKKNNQNFVNIPFAKLIKLVKYKAEEVGIDVLDPTEEYTSKCSFLDTEELCHHDKYIGERIHRGLFRSSKGLSIKKGKKTVLINEINTDVQGAYNMIRKVDPKFTVKSIMEGVAVHGLVPKRLSVSGLL